MTFKDTNEYNTDLAWNRLYGRLEREDLLPSKQHVKARVFYSSLKWVAAIFIICLGIAYVAIEKDSPIHQNTIILTNSDDSSTLVDVLEDGSMVFLCGKSSLDFPLHFGDEKRLVRLTGNAYFDVEKGSKPFIVETSKMKIEVLGTEFDVKEDRDVSVSVRRGKVKVTDKSNGKFTFVNAGETSVLHSDNLYTIKTADVSQFSEYFSHVLIKDKKLEDVVKVLNNRQDSVRVECDPALHDRLLTMSFSNETSLDLVKYICLALNLDYVKNKDSIRIINKVSQ